MRNVPIDDAETMEKHFDALKWKGVLGVIGHAVVLGYTGAIVVFSVFVVRSL
jgi:hypothetical protein